MTVPSVRTAQTYPTTWKLIVYGGVAMPLCMAATPIVTYLPAFYAQELHLSVALVGLVFLSARLWDGIADLLVGWLSDRSMSRHGRRKPWVIAATPFLMLSTWFLCNPPSNAGLPYLIVWAAFFYTAWTAIYIPYLSWGAEMATGYLARSRVTAFREAFNMLGLLVFAVAPLLFLSSHAPLHKVLFMTAVIVEGMLLVTVIPLALFIKDSAPTKRPGAPLLQAIASLAKDHVLIRFISGILLMWIGAGVVNSLAVFAFTVGLRLPDKLFWVIFILSITTVGAMPLTVRLGQRVEKHKLLAAAIAVLVISYGAWFFIPLANFPIAAAVLVMAGVAQSCTYVLPTSILADIIDHGEVLEGERRSGAYVAVYNLALKVGLALGVGVAFGALAVVHYNPSAAHYSDTDMLKIRLLGFGLPGLLYASSIPLLLTHPITRTVHTRLRRTIDLRSGESGSGGLAEEGQGIAR